MNTKATLLGSANTEDAKRWPLKLEKPRNWELKLVIEASLML